jgi:hypothetical protein
LLLLFIFLTSLLTPVNNDWESAFENLRKSREWDLDASSIIGKILNKGYTVNTTYFAREFESETDGTVIGVAMPERGKIRIDVGRIKTFYYDGAGRIRPRPEEPTGLRMASEFDSLTLLKSYYLPRDSKILISEGEDIGIGEKIAEGRFINPIFFADLSKFLLTALFIFLMFMVYWAGIRDRSTKKNTP